MARFVRYEATDGARYGELKGSSIVPLEGAFGSLQPSGEPAIALDSVKLLAPTTPRQIVAVGPNYMAHFNGGPMPFPRTYYWIKPASTLLDPEGTIEIPGFLSGAVHESELAIVIGKRAKNVSVADAPAHIFGYTCINDVTGGGSPTDPSFHASQFFVDGKIYDTFAPIGPWIETEIDPGNLRVQCRVNGETRQDHNTSDFIYPPAELLSQISHVMTLHPGDVIATGSPPGPAPIVDGDVVEIEVENIGVLRNHVRQTD